MPSRKTRATPPAGNAAERHLRAVERDARKTLGLILRIDPKAVEREPLARMVFDEFVNLIRAQIKILGRERWEKATRSVWEKTAA